MEGLCFIMSQNQVATTGWKKQSGYIWSLIGSAVGFANILSFSSHCYKNGGGAFLIPYFAALFILGIPLLLLEGLVGYKWKEPLVSAYGRVSGKTGKTLGWLAVFACATIGGFYIVLTGYSIAYAYFSATNQIPDETATFFTHGFLKATSSISDFGAFSYPVCIATIVVAIFAWFVLVRNVKDGVEKICSIFMPLLAVIMVAFAIFVCFLPGGLDGWSYYLKPNFSKLLDASLWRDVFGQLLFSLSLGLGIIVGYSRHTGEKIDVVKAMKWVALGDFSVSFISGFAIFGCLAHISHMTGVPFEKILSSDSTFEIGFIIFPKILKHFGPILSQVFGTIFFFSVFIAGVTGVFSIIESIAGNVEVEFACTRRKAVTWTMIFTMCLALVFCMGNSSHLIDALAPMVIGSNMLIGSLALILTFMYVGKERGIGQHPVWFSGERYSFYAISLKYIVPVFLVIILAGNLYQEASNVTLAVAIRWIWFFLALGFSYALSVKAKKSVPQPIYN